MIEAILWDNDGVLVDTEPLFLQASREILDEIGIQFDEDLYRAISLQRGQSIFTLAEERGHSADAIALLREKRNRRYATLLDAGVLTLEGVADCLSELHGHHRMAIVTSSQRDHFDRIHRQTDLLGYFELTLAAGDYARHKPHPDPYLEAARRLGIPPAHCLAIEDTERGLTAAVAAGMRCVVIPRPLSRDSDFGAAHTVLDTATDVPRVIESLLR